MLEASIVAALLNREAWLQYNTALDWVAIKGNTPDIYKILLVVKRWHETHQDSLNIDELGVYFNLEFPGMSDKEQARYNDIFTMVAEQSIRDELVADYLKQLKNQQIRRNIAVDCINDKIPNEKIIEQIEQLTKDELVTEEQEFVTTDIFELLKRNEENPGLEWKLDEFNRSLGPLRKGTLICFFAQPDTGKTCLWISEVANFAKQIPEDEHIVIFCNEEYGDGVMERLYCSICQKTAVAIETYPEQACEVFSRRGGDKIRLIYQSDITPALVKKTLDSLKPALVVIDNIDEVKGMVAEREDKALGMKYRWAREIAIKYAPTLVISQASMTTPGKRYLTQQDMTNSKVAKPGALDAAVGITKREDAGYEYVRYLSVCKNKRRGCKGLKEEDRYLKFSCKIVPEISSYESL